ncbi:hypothetical protein DBR32_04100 [Taibaiella sp. KBW10]|uniref:lipoprotein N-acyltransferase Lnb domain-containing protein n=1 Tax=Taibaiella sp. KBW10 TaxID=2153357 RepID=UPI000F5A88EA|nr:DUF4105 domain-containing protein [Taibaiella sp. KBW10]RQO31991.1 hypothetical protein DBR32_04100 [Taibaiella sp. KBW10]
MRILFAFFLLCLSFCARAQQDTSRIRISVLTCGTGEELYTTFGHSGVRVVDSNAQTDLVYNYGLFNFSDPDFYSKFTRGKLLYFVGTESFPDFMSTYQYEKRNVAEEVMNVGMADKQRIIQYLKENLKPENRSYQYDFLFDNCATRIRDIFPNTLDTSFRYGAVLNAKKVTFRAILNEYLRANHWSRLGINILLASKIDREMTDEEAMFLPDMLYTGLRTATYHQKVLMSEITTIYKGADKPKLGPNKPLWMMMALLLLVLLVFFVRPLRRLKNILSFTLLLLSGALGCFILFMWFGTDHKSCDNNYNILWAFPLNLIVAFTMFKPRKWHIKYSLFAIGLLMVALLIHSAGIQVMPLIELLPFFVSLLYIYMYMYKRALAAYAAQAKPR